MNHGEVSIGKYFLDGYYVLDSVRCQFNGCSYHGCRKCYEPHRTNPLTHLPYGVLARQFDTKVDILQNAYGLKIEVMWECEWNKLKWKNPSVIEFMSTYTAPERLKPRNALFGGRTNVYKPYHKVVEGEKISYLDFTSLYPFCKATKTYAKNSHAIRLDTLIGLVDSYVTSGDSS